VAVSEGHEESSNLRRWMWQGPHASSVQDECTGVALGASSYARLESGDRRLCVRGLRMVTSWQRSLSSHSVLQRAAVLA
jgi:hypothetical protein